VSSGVLANFLVDLTKSFVAPFLVAIVFLCIGGSIVLLTWNENYGDAKPTVLSKSKNEEKGLAGRWSVKNLSLYEGFAAVLSDPRIFIIGVMVSTFESSVYLHTS
jgi:hypothetical protein